MAMGAEAGRVVRLVLQRGFLLVLVGGLAGGVGAALLGRVLSSMLFVSAFDPVSYGAAFGVLVLVALAAHLVPVRRATRVDPVTALRTE
jgi:ABC-type antimicrobial peptide transport system permease subunit